MALTGASSIAALVIFSAHDDSSPVWQRLYTILSAWIEMIERRKVAVVRNDFGNGPDPASGVYLDMRDP
jgi:hypothetical protein